MRKILLPPGAKNTVAGFWVQLRNKNTVAALAGLALRNKNTVAALAGRPCEIKILCRPGRPAVRNKNTVAALGGRPGGRGAATVFIFLGEKYCCRGNSLFRSAKSPVVAATLYFAVRKIVALLFFAANLKPCCAQY